MLLVIDGVVGVVQAVLKLATLRAGQLAARFAVAGFGAAKARFAGFQTLGLAVRQLPAMLTLFDARVSGNAGDR